MPTANTIPISIFQMLREHFGTTLQPMRCTKATLVHISHTLEDMVLSQQLPALLFTGFQESSHWREETERYRALADIAQQVCIFAGGTLPPEGSARELHVTLGGDDPLRQEWFLALLCPQFSVLLCGQDRHVDTADEAMRQFDTLWSFQPEVIQHVLDMLEQVIANYRPERLDTLRAARQQYPLVAPDPDLVTRFTIELIRFEEELHQQLAATSKQLKQQIIWREDLLATLVHDLRNPLQAIVLSMNMIDASKTITDPNTNALLALGLSGADQLHTLIQMILDTNQLAEGRLRLDLNQIHLEAWVHELCMPFHLKAEHFKFSCEIDSEIDLIWGDKVLLSRAVQNLIGNAMKFTPIGGKISLTVTHAPKPGWIEIRVRDTGAGINPDLLPHIFDRYYQAQGNDRRGYGLGLYFCRLVADAHQGSIRVNSQFGAGTAFTLSLPIQPQIVL